MRYQVFLETSTETVEEGGYLAHVPELIGCVARGATKEEAVEKIREAIRAYHAWMRKHHAAAPSENEPLDLDVVETEAFMLPSDYVPMHEDEVGELARRAASLRQRLLELLAEMPPEALDWKESEEGWAIRNVVAHMAQSDLYYASRLEEPGLPELVWRLESTRELALRRLQQFSGEAHRRVMRHNGEEWTPRKVARRMLEHEQEHLDQIHELLKRYLNSNRS